MADLVIEAGPPPGEHKAWSGQLAKATQGDKAAMAKIFAPAPDQPELAKYQRNLVKQSNVAAVALTSQLGKIPNAFLVECTTRQLAKMRKELSGDNPTPLETLLVERVLLCWVDLHRQELILTTSSGMSIKQGEYHNKQLDRSHKRYLASIKTLAQVRKLQLPSVQVNIGDKQVNVGQVSSAR